MPYYGRCHYFLLWSGFLHLLGLLRISFANEWYCAGYHEMMISLLCVC